MAAWAFPRGLARRASGNGQGARRKGAGQAGVPFFSISGSEFVKMFVGLGAARVLHHFIDELDALGKARGGGTFGGHDEKEQTFNRLLTELDGFDRREGIVLLGATNRPEVLDPALLRAGRFDRRVVLDRPDRKGREAILKVHTKRITLAADVRLDEIAGRALAAPICPISNCGSKVPARSRGTSICTRHPPFWRSPRCSYCRCPIKLASMAQLATVRSVSFSHFIGWQYSWQRSAKSSKAICAKRARSSAVMRSNDRCGELLRTSCYGFVI